MRDELTLGNGTNTHTKRTKETFTKEIINTRNHRKYEKERGTQGDIIIRYYNK